MFYQKHQYYTHLYTRTCHVPNNTMKLTVTTIQPNGQSYNEDTDYPSVRYVNHTESYSSVPHVLCSGKALLCEGKVRLQKKKRKKKQE